LLVVGLLLAAGCGGNAPERPQDGLLVFVTVEPQAYVVQRIGGEHVAVEVLVPSGQDPHTFQLSPRQVRELSRADLYFEIGLPLERRLLEKIRDTDAGLSVVDMAAGVARLSADGHTHDEATGEERDGHDRGAESDPHVWLSLPNLKQLAVNTARALKQADPDHAAYYQANLDALAAELDERDAAIRRRLEPFRGRTICVFHPAFGYFADAYGLKQRAVQVGGVSPSPKEIRRLIEEARADGARAIFVQPQFDPSPAKTIAEAIGGEVVPIDPLAKDVPANLEATAEKIAGALKPREGEAARLPERPDAVSQQ